MDPYNVLGVDRTATPEEIKTAYRKLAAKNHPDRGGNTSVFQEIQAAYDTLTDPDKKAVLDNEHHFREYTGNPFQDFINQFMHTSRQRIYTVTVFVTLEQLVAGRVENVQITTPVGSKLLQLEIPIGVEDGSQVRYEGIMADGILQVLYRVHRHPKFTRHGNDLHCTEHIDFFKLILGTKIWVTDITGKSWEIMVPELTKPGTKLRIAGKGIAGGDQYVLIDGVLPAKIDASVLSAIRNSVEGGAA